MEAPDVKISKSGSTLRFSQEISLPATFLEGIDLKRGDTLTLDLTTSVDIDEIVKLIGDKVPPGTPPGLLKRIAEASLIAAAAAAGKDLVVEGIKKLPEIFK